MTAVSRRVRYVGFANAVIPGSDYRLGFARDSDVADVILALPGRPDALARDQFVAIGVREGFSWRSIRELLRIPGILRASDADVAHFFATQFVLAGPILARVVGVRSIITVTGTGRSFEANGRARRWRAYAYRGLFRGAAALSDWILFQNEGDLLVLAPAAGARNARKIRMIGSAVDEAAFERVSPEPKAQRSVCLMVARVQKAKGVEDFLDAARLLKGKADFVLVGPPTDGQDELMRAVEDLSASGLLRYVGPATDAEVRAWYQRANLVFLPSRSEGIPRVALEAGVSGRAVLAYDIPGCAAALPPAALVAAGDQDAMMRRLHELCTDARARDALAQDVRRWVRERFALSKYVEQLDVLVAAAAEHRYPK